MKAYYFSTEDRKLRNGDNRVIRIGKTHTVKGKIELCERGLHASKRVSDALQYAPGPILYEVELSGEILEGMDKVVASKRKYIKCYGDVSDKLMLFARRQALIHIELIAPYCTLNEYRLLIDYLNTGDESKKREVSSLMYRLISTIRYGSAAYWRGKAIQVTLSGFVGDLAAHSARRAGNIAEYITYAEPNKMLKEILGIE